MQAWTTLDAVETDHGRLELRQRGERDFLITIAGRVLMTSAARESELALARLTCERLDRVRAPRVLVGGLGMGLTLRAALDALPPDARVLLVELEPRVVDWCRGPLAPVHGDALADPRVVVEVGDVAAAIARAAGGRAADRFEAILLDLHEGPQAGARRRGEPFYGDGALGRARDALAPRGVLGIWSESPDAPFEKRLGRAGFAVTRQRAGRGGRRHVVYVATRETARKRGRTR